MLGTKPLPLGRAANAFNQQAISPAPRPELLTTDVEHWNNFLPTWKKKKTKINLYLYLAIVCCVIFHKLKLNITLNV